MWWPSTVRCSAPAWPAWWPIEDRVALQYLKAHAGVISESVGCIGLSGGGCRAALLQATSPDISASVIVGMMSTYDQLLDRHVASHTWMLFPPGLMSLGDWPDLASCRAPSPLAVQYCRDDELFSLEGMVRAHERIARGVFVCWCRRRTTSVSFTTAGTSLTGSCRPLLSRS